ncbi:MAG TPA: PDZ domain-containing protein [Acidimicrobiales bacterium]|nr:PDZ domain-containing protein [Acidimicrobiales bacterium]
MEPDEGMDEEGPSTPLLPPDDRLWRHPSEMHLAGSSRGGGAGNFGSQPSSGRAAGPASTSASGPASGSSSVSHGFERLGNHRVWAVAIVAGVVGALAASGIGMVTGIFEQHTTVIRSVTAQGPELTLASDNPAGSINWTAIDDTLAPSVVAVSVNSPSGPAVGSGMLFLQGSSSSYIITDSALFAGGGSILVSYLSGETSRARLIASDPTSGIALLSVPNRPGPFPVLGSVADLRVANPVLAIGARASAGGSVFAGSVTAEDREVDVAGGLLMENMIAASASQVPDSLGGGPLVDGQGRVVGITVSLDPTNNTDQGLVFAVPVDVVERIAQEMLDGSSIDHPWIGVSDAADLSSSVAHQLGVSGGAQVGQVLPGSPASRVGLTSNDVITAFNGIPVTSTGTLTRLVSQCTPGKQAPISYIRGGLARTAEVTVSNQPGGD